MFVIFLVHNLQNLFEFYFRLFIHRYFLNNLLIKNFLFFELGFLNLIIDINALKVHDKVIHLFVKLFLIKTLILHYKFLNWKIN